ncbi:MAG: hypothetical protein D6725_03655 [Planctomycetota bacterium]|nr:MAG: hypothetical protein D6725_03655 [Planctomycetota bacterium]
MVGSGVPWHRRRRSDARGFGDRWSRRVLRYRSPCYCRGRLHRDAGEVTDRSVTDKRRVFSARLGLMQIDWFTFTAQIVNFLILVWLLKRFLYGPILAAMERRERSIEERLEAARRLRDEAERERAALEADRAKWDAQKAQLLQEARQEAARLRDRLVAEVRADVEQQRARWLESLRRERETLVRQLREVVAETALRTAESILRELADVSLQDRMLQKLLEHWRTRPEAERSRLQNLLRQRDRPVVVRTAFAVDPAQRDEWTRRLAEITGERTAVEFVTDPELVCGLELHANGYKLSWAVGDALQDVRERIAAALENVAADTGAPARETDTPDAEAGQTVRSDA